MLRMSRTVAAEIINENAMSGSSILSEINLFSFWVLRAKMWGESPYPGALLVTMAESQVTLKPCTVLTGPVS